MINAISVPFGFACPEGRKPGRIVAKKGQLSSYFRLSSVKASGGNVKPPDFGGLRFRGCIFQGVENPAE
jgi:hypothetical protein